MTSTSIYQETPLSYVYRLDHQTTGEFYFGFRKANSVPASQDLGIYYFTSSKYVEPRFHEFNYTIIQEFNDPLEAYDLEQLLIYQELKNPLMMNRRCYYGSKSRFSTIGTSCSEETRAKLSAARKGKKRGPCSEETRAKLSAAHKGVPRSAETKAKISAGGKGIPKPHTVEHSANISAAKKGVSVGKGISKGKGIPKSTESNAKRSASMQDKNIGPKPKFFSIIETRKTYTKNNLSQYYPEFKQYY